MMYLFLAGGFEEIEALSTLDVLRRAELEVYTVGVGGKVITGAHQIPVTADVMESEIAPDPQMEGVILPGGMPGTLNLEGSARVQECIDYAVENGRLIAAICAAPSILGHKRLLEGRRAVCFPGFEGELAGARVLDTPVCVDGNIITAKGAGVALDFGLEIVRHFQGIEAARRLRGAMQCV